MLIFILLSAHVQDSSKSFFHKFLYYTIFLLLLSIVLFFRFTIEINVFVCIFIISHFLLSLCFCLDAGFHITPERQQLFQFLFFTVKVLMAPLICEGSGILTDFSKPVT